ncbi:endonuclease/exonuclease/phosphatase family protein [Rhodopirellula sallentina]|nr:endonuclease/exonuclease/phosphatase family protein [Rhodopirellula sallentina]
MNLGSFSGQQQPDTINAVRIASSNVLAANNRHESILADLQNTNADVIAVIELTPALATRLQDALKESHPHQTFQARAGDNFGIGILSRWPIRSVQTLQWSGTPASLEVEFDHFRMIATHPIPPIGQANFQNRNRQLQKLAEHIRDSLQTDRATVLVGDLNLTPWNANFTDLLATAELKRAASVCEILPTWYARPLFPLGLLIDHVLISKDLTYHDYQIGEDCGSDHRSVAVTISPVDQPSMAHSPKEASIPKAQ